MIYALTGTIRKLPLPNIGVDIAGVTYLTSVPHPVWDAMTDGEQSTLVVFTFVREDRLELFGFRTPDERSLFTELLNISGIGPKIALELCSIPMTMLRRAAETDDSASLTAIKGIGRKTAEKLLVDLKSLFEKHPEWTSKSADNTQERSASFDVDAIAALSSLGYDQHTILGALKRLPTTLKKTEERVAAALRSL
ncbi:Holliday junction branch migration protein RuvA [Candidatus Peribacteria bacterium]|nr:Holliday junction branch migration protein RuvA [Candidatus Peribacteria bacterium]